MESIKKSELIKNLAEDIARNGDGPVFLLWEKGKRNKEMRCPILGGVQRRSSYAAGVYSVVQVFEIETRSEAVDE